MCTMNACIFFLANFKIFLSMVQAPKDVVFMNVVDLMSNEENIERIFFIFISNKKNAASDEYFFQTFHLMNLQRDH